MSDKTQHRVDPFAAIVAKEFRANLKWAILGAAFTSAVLLIGIAGELQSTAPDFISLAEGYAVATLLVGFAIGILSIINENRGDPLGFFVHRPYSRSNLFAAKVAGGLALYFAAVGVPMLFAIMWCMTPGNIAMPFDVLHLRPAIIDALMGVFSYFTGFFCAMREARWFATRWLAALALILISSAIFMLMSFWEAFGISVLAIFISGVGAWATFSASGRYEQQVAAGRVASGVVVLAGLVAASVILLFPTFDWLASAFRRETTGQVAVPQRIVNIEVSKRGLVRVSRERGNVVEISDMSGNSIEKPAWGKMFDSVSSNEIPLVTTSRGYRLDASYRDASAVFTSISTWPARRINWNYVHRDRLVVGYDLMTKLPSDWVGKSGALQSDKVTESDRFDGELLAAYQFTAPSAERKLLLAFPAEIVAIGLNDKTSETIFKAKSGERVLWSEMGEREIHFSTTEGAYAFSLDGRLLFVAAPDSGMTSLNLFRVTRPDTVYRFAAFKQSSGPMVRVTEVASLSPGGTVLERHPAPINQLPDAASSRMLYEIMGVVSPPLLHLLRIYPVMVDDYGRPYTHRSWFFSMLVALSALSSLIALAVARRYAFSPGRTASWIVICAVLGPIGVALMLSLLELPALERCSSCGRERVVTRATCEHCGSSFAPPVLDGTEILELPALAR